MERRYREQTELRRRGGRQRLSNFGLVVLATLSRHIAHYGVLTMPAATILCRFEGASPLLEAGEAGRGQKREEGQDHDAQ
jgi:hypothetical protein